MATKTNRRAFLGTISMAAATSIAGPVMASSGKACIASSVPLWQIRRGDYVDSYALRRAGARHAVTQGNRFSIKPKHTSRQTAGTFPGTTFRLTWCSWYGYRAAVAGIAERQQGEIDPGNDTTVASTLQSIGWDLERLKADIQAAKAGGSAWIFGCHPQHALDVPDPVQSGEDRIEAAGLFSDRASAIGEAARSNLELMARGDHMDDWAVVLEIGEELPDATDAVVDYCGGVGLECRCTFRPVRIVRPTMEEIERFARV